MTKLAFHLPVNSVSFGQISTMLLRVLHEREKAGTLPFDLYFFPIGNIDLASQTNLSPEFVPWLQGKIVKAVESYTRDTPVFKLWHLTGSLESVSRQQTLLTFYELDNPTRVEINIAKNNRVFLTNQYSVDVFRLFGLDAQLLTLAFDSYNFTNLGRKFHSDDRIVFNLCGKLEKRKHHDKIITTWIRRFGGNPKFALQCATYNVFLGNSQQECDRNNNEMIRQILGGNKPFNVSFLPLMRDNASYNDFLNSSHIVIGMSGGEGWGLPEFQSVALGKHAVLLNAHAYPTWAKLDMATFVNPNGKVSAVDNMFFKAGEPFNQGNVFDWNPDEFIAACETAIQKVQSNPVNTAGLTLQQTHTKEAFADNVLRIMS